MVSDERIIHEVAVMYARALKRDVADPFESELHTVLTIQNMTEEEFDRLVGQARSLGVSVTGHINRPAMRFYRALQAGFIPTLPAAHGKHCHTNRTRTQRR